MIFKDNPELRRLTGVAFSLLCDRKKGDLILWEDVESAMGMAKDWTNSMWKGAIDAARSRMLREFRITTDCKTDVGIRLLTDEEVAREQVTKRIRKSRSQCTRGIREVSTVTLDKLPMHERRLAVAGMDVLQQSRQMANSALREAKEPVRVVETLPRRKAQ